MRLKYRLILAATRTLRLIGLDLILIATTRTWVEDGWERHEVTGRSWRVRRHLAR